MDYKRLGKETCVRLGTYPALSIPAARLKRDETLQLIASGIDPALQKKEQRKQEQASRPITPKLQFSMSDQGGIIIENYTSRMTLSESQTIALKLFLLSSPNE